MGVILRILIAEDDATIAEALRFALTRDGYAVDWVANGAQADHALKDNVFDLVILDLQLPALDGYEVLRRLRQRKTSLPVLILSGREKPEEKVFGLDLGADDYLVKPFSLNELQARVRALLRRGQGGAAPVIAYGKLSFDCVERGVSIDGRPIELSRQELSVLEALINRFGRVVSKSQLVDKLYNYDNSGSQNAIEVYVHRLRKKIEESGITIRTRYGQGYIMEESMKDAGG
jgi:two-component system, OmpR family, response regulator